MTPKEIVERVKVCVQDGRDFCQSMDIPEPTTLQHCSDIDHLLAIHAAVVEMLDARHEANTTRDMEVLIRATERQAEKTNALAALCGWKAEDET